MPRHEAGYGAACMWLEIGSLILAGLVWSCFCVPNGHVRRQRFRWHADAVRLVCCYGILGFGYIIPATYLPVYDKECAAWLKRICMFMARVRESLPNRDCSFAALRQRMGNRSLWAFSHWGRQ